MNPEKISEKNIQIQELKFAIKFFPGLLQNYFLFTLINKDKEEILPSLKKIKETIIQIQKICPHLDYYSDIEFSLNPFNLFRKVHKTCVSCGKEF